MAERVEDYCKRNPVVLDNMSPDDRQALVFALLMIDRIIWITPGETILAHTNEFIGGCKSVTTMMKARSSLGRNFIEVCKCAGWGDVGYINRWYGLLFLFWASSALTSYQDNGDYQ